MKRTSQIIKKYNIETVDQLFRTADNSDIVVCLKSRLPHGMLVNDVSDDGFRMQDECH